MRKLIAACRHIASTGSITRMGIEIRVKIDELLNLLNSAKSLVMQLEDSAKPLRDLQNLDSIVLELKQRRGETPASRLSDL
ncbi:MAG: hypothetical protein ACRDL7_12970 [Gaiellaceae bacterium]